MHKFMIAGTRSGVGKTSITIAIISVLKKMGFRVQPFKVGPDFIDTGYHSYISKKKSINLDGWMLKKSYNIRNFWRYSKDVDVAIVEGVMGFYDGINSVSENGSSAQMSKWLRLPVILVVDGKAIARSIAALIYGFKNFDNNTNIAGVIFNNVSGENHFKYLKTSVLACCNVNILGYFKKNELPHIPSRHLGLLTIENNSQFQSKIKIFEKVAQKRIDLKQLLKITKSENCFKKYNVIRKIKPKIKIGIPKDSAFCFYYQDNLDILTKYGAELVFFNTLYDKKLPYGISSLYIGGGYPELYAETLSSNEHMRKDIKNFIESGYPTYAECGGFMYLTKGIKIKNRLYSMVGIFDDNIIIKNKLIALGYCEIRLNKNSIIGKKNQICRGHEFHYSHLEKDSKNLNKIYTVKKGGRYKDGGYEYNNCIGSYIHIHFGSNQTMAHHFVSICSTFKSYNNIQ